MKLRSSTATYSRRWSRRSSWEKETTPTRSSSSSRRSQCGRVHPQEQSRQDNQRNYVSTTSNRLCKTGGRQIQQHMWSASRCYAEKTSKIAEKGLKNVKIGTF